MVEEAGSQVRGAVGPGRHLATATKVHAAQEQRASLGVLEVRPIEADGWRGCAHSSTPGSTAISSGGASNAASGPL